MRAFIFMWLNYLDKNWESVSVSEKYFFKIQTRQTRHSI